MARDAAEKPAILATQSWQDGRRSRPGTSATIVWSQGVPVRTSPRASQRCKLNQLLADELAAINQYIVHSEMCANWGYDRLHESVEKRAIQEMKHAEKLIARILFLEGTPTVSQLGAIHFDKSML